MPSSVWQSAFTASYRFMVVDRATGDEVRQLSNVNGKSIERNQDKSIFESASIEYEGELGVGADYVRAYLDAEDPMTGETVSECLGTYLCSVPSRDLDGAEASGEADLYGLLQLLAQDDFDTIYAVQAGSNAVEKAAAIARTCGLDVLADDSDYCTTAQLVFGAGSDDDTKLDAVNALLELAGFASASTDPYGRVLMRRYVEPAERPSAWTFREGVDARFLRQATAEADAFDVANVVHVDYATQEHTIRGTAVDDDPASPYSTANRPRCVNRYSYSDVPEGATDDEVQLLANQKAMTLLTSERSVTHKIKFKAVYRPLSVGDAVTLEVPTWGISHKYAIRTESIEMGAGCVVTYEARWFER